MMMMMMMMKKMGQKGKLDIGFIFLSPLTTLLFHFVLLLLLLLLILLSHRYRLVGAMAWL